MQFAIHNRVGVVSFSLVKGESTEVVVAFAPTESGRLEETLKIVAEFFLKRQRLTMRASVFGCR
jgi:hypothetical protein